MSRKFVIQLYGEISGCRNVSDFVGSSYFADFCEGKALHNRYSLADILYSFKVILCKLVWEVFLQSGNALLVSVFLFLLYFNDLFTLHRHKKYVKIIKYDLGAVFLTHLRYFQLQTS